MSKKYLNARGQEMAWQELIIESIFKFLSYDEFIYV